MVDRIILKLIRLLETCVQKSNTAKRRKSVNWSWRSSKSRICYRGLWLWIHGQVPYSIMFSVLAGDPVINAARVGQDRQHLYVITRCDVNRSVLRRVRLSLFHCHAGSQSVSQSDRPLASYLCIYVADIFAPIKLDFRTCQY